MQIRSTPTAPRRWREATALLQIPIVHLSTDYVFDGTLDCSYCEDDPPCPINAYGSSKLSGEQLVEAAIGKNFARTMLSLAAARDEISVVSDQRGAPSNALDVADGIFNVLRNLVARPVDAAIRGIFHMTDSRPRSSPPPQRTTGPSVRYERLPVQLTPQRPVDQQTRG